MRFGFYISLTLFSLFFFSGCSSKELSSLIDVSNTENLATSPPFAVITTPYIAYLERPISTAKARNYARIGDVAEIIGSSIDILSENRELWYQFEKGWLPEGAIKIYPNKFKAEFATRQLQ